MQSEEIIFELVTNQRHPVYDADEILSNDDGTEVYAIHYTDAGSVNINFGYYRASDYGLARDGRKRVYHFDIFEEP